jgi:hypothetical protein
MKKIILSLLLCILFISDINGETITHISDNTISLSYDIAPTYSVVLPNTIDITNNKSEFNFTVSGDIYADTYLEIIFNQCTYISSEKDNIKVTINQAKTNFTYEELSNSNINSSITLNEINE